MPTFSYEQLHELSVRILTAAGASADEATVVARELADANLVGHDSHGVIRLKQYADYIDQGFIKPGAKIEVVIEKPSILVIDGNYNFGQVVAARAWELVTERARTSGAFTVLCRHVNHSGRLGSYTRQAALRGFAALMAVNAPAGGGVVPWGAVEPRLGTNPISIAAPWRDDAIVLDMTSSATAEGKLRVAMQKGESVPAGWIIDKDGNPSTDPNDFYAGGGILPLGGPMGFKGYGLSVMMDLVCGIISGGGVVQKHLPPGMNAIWTMAMDIEQLVDPDEYRATLDKYTTWIKSAAKAPGVDEILLPGEIEARRQTQRRRDGVIVPDETFKQIEQLANGLGASLKDL